MATLHIIYDPTNKVCFPSDIPSEIRSAQMYVPTDLSEQELQMVARKLTAMLLESVQP